MIHHAPPAKPHGASVRIVVVSGQHQRAHAFAATTGPGYETLFAQPLVVKILGKGTHTVRFSCEQVACRFAVSDQPNEVRRIDTRSYDIDVKDGRAELTLTLATDSVPGHYTIAVRPVVGKRTLPGKHPTAFDVTVE